MENQKEQTNKCASYEEIPNIRCSENAISSSVFCAKHSEKFLGKYLKYKKIDNDDTLFPNMPSKYYLKKLVRFQTIIQKRTEFREEAISFSARDIGHSIRINILCNLADQCVEYLKEIFAKPMKAQDTKLPSEKKDEIKQRKFQKIFKIYKATKKLQEDWGNHISHFVRQDNANMIYDTEVFYRKILEIPGTEGFTLDLMMRLGNFHSILCDVLDTPNLIIYYNLEKCYHAPHQLFNLLRAFGCSFTNSDKGLLLDLPVFPPVETVLGFLKLAKILEKTSSSVFLSTSYYSRCKNGTWFITPLCKFFVSIGYDDGNIKNSQMVIQEFPTEIRFQKLNINLNGILNDEYSEPITELIERFPLIDPNRIIQEYCVQSIVTKIQLVLKFPLDRLFSILDEQNELLIKLLGKCTIEIAKDELARKYKFKNINVYVK